MRDNCAGNKISELSEILTPHAKCINSAVFATKLAA
jgi:hypothetical protein